LQRYIFSGLPDEKHLAGSKYLNIFPYNAKAYIRENLQQEYPALPAKKTEIFISYYF
jgi:hypothetical protein